MTEQAAKLTVKVKLHAAQPMVLPTKAPPARLSKLKVFLGVLLLVLLSAAGYFLWQRWVGIVPDAVAADHQVLPESSTKTAGETSAMVSTDEKLHTKTTVEDQTATSPKDQPHTDAKQAAVVPAAETVAEVGAKPASAEPAPMPVVIRTLPDGFSRIVLAATMEQLEPGPAIDALVAQQDIQRLYLFTELKGYAGQQLIHRWSFAGKVQTEALLTIEDSPWRTYSEKWLLPDQLGNWRVEIIDQQQQVLYQHDFLYQ